jgi:hypothetical protein
VIEHVDDLRADLGRPFTEAKPRPIVRRDGESILIDIPMTFRRRGKRREIVLPPGTALADSPVPPSPLALAVARAFRWQEMIESGEAESVSDLARRLKLDTSFVARTIRLTALAPDVIGAILAGQEPDGLSLRRLRGDVPVLWEEQRHHISDSALARTCRVVSAGTLSAATGDSACSDARKV